MAAAAPLIFRQRGNHVPSFCPWQHKSPEEMQAVKVVFHGVPLPPGFTVDRVAPERRWAIQLSGEVLDGHAFSDLYIRKFVEWFRVAYNPPLRPPGKESNEPIPNPLEYVSQEVDPTNDQRVRKIGYDPLANRRTRHRPDYLVDQNGENPRPYDEVILETYSKNPALLKEDERKYAERLLGKTGVEGGGAVAAQLQLLVELRSAGKLSDADFADQAARLTGAKLVQPKAAMAAAPAPVAGQRDDDDDLEERPAEARPPQPELTCPDCGFQSSKKNGLILHRRFKHKGG